MAAVDGLNDDELMSEKNSPGSSVFKKGLIKKFMILGYKFKKVYISCFKASLTLSYK